MHFGNNKEENAETKRQREREQTLISVLTKTLLLKDEVMMGFKFKGFEGQLQCRKELCYCEKKERKEL